MMYRQITLKSLIILGLTALLTSCAGTHEVTYRGGMLVVPGPLAIQTHYSFRFMEKWRISHDWLSGPVEIANCTYGGNVFKRIEGFPALANEPNGPMFEVDGRLYEGAAISTSYIYLSAVTAEKIYGTNTRTGDFKGYSAFCTHTFQDIWTGPSVFLIKPDPAKGTDAWIAGAKPMLVNGLQWLRKDIPIEDFSQNHKQWAAPIEIWVLRIPDTPYWFVMRLGGSSGGTGTAPGINRNPEKFARVVDLFHQMVASVKLEPITPVDIGTLKIKPAQ